MLRIALVFGSLAGLVVIGGILTTFAFTGAEGSPVWLGYLIMIVALSMIFFGVKRHRDRDLGGVIQFLPALGLGLSIAVVAGLAYVGVWEIYLWATDYSFMDTYTAAIIESRKAHGISGAALQAEIAQMQALKNDYANPLIRLPMTFIEIFPVGVVISLISAALLRNPKVLPDRVQVAG